MPLKFAFVVGCFVIAGGSFFFCKQKRDWAWLVLGFMFTVGADYFLVVRNLHLPGVAVFCFAHMCYILRAVGSPSVTASRTKPRYKVLLFCVLIASIFVVFINGWLIVLSGIYAALFITNIAVNFNFQKINRPLVLTGLILFALCDINVALLNLPRHFDINLTFPWTFRLIWVFYLPSQLLLAVSATRLKRLI